MNDLFDHARVSSPAPISAEPSTRTAARKAPRPSGGVSARDILLFAATAAVFVWGAWVTRTIASGATDRQEFVQLQLQGIIGEYLQAQARSNVDEQTAARQTAVFMAALDETVSGLSKSGKVVLVHEAIVGGDLPDMTPSVKEAVYARVPRPQIAQAPQGMGQRTGQGAAQGQGQGQGQAAQVEREMHAFMAANRGEQRGGR